MRELFGSFFGNAEAARSEIKVSPPAQNPKPSPVFHSPNDVITGVEEVSNYARAQDNLIRAHSYAIPLTSHRSNPPPPPPPLRRKELAAVHKPEYKEKLTLYDVRSFQKRRRGILGKELRRLIAVQELAMKARAIDYSIEDALDVKAFEEDHQISSDSSDASSVSGEQSLRQSLRQTKDMRDEEVTTNTHTKKGESNKPPPPPPSSQKSELEQNMSGMNTSNNPERRSSLSHKAAGAEQPISNSLSFSTLKTNSKPLSAAQPETTTMIPLANSTDDSTAAGNNLAQASDSMMPPNPPVAEVTTAAPLSFLSNTGSLFASKPEAPPETNTTTATNTAPLFSSLSQPGPEIQPVSVQDKPAASSMSLFGSSNADPQTATSKPDVPPPSTGLFSSSFFGATDASVNQPQIRPPPVNSTPSASQSLFTGMDMTNAPKPTAADTPTGGGMSAGLGAGGLFSSAVTKPETTTTTTTGPLSLFGSASAAKPSGGSLFGNIGEGSSSNVLTQASQPSIFQAAEPATSSTGLFGSTSGSLFANTAPTAPVTTSLFAAAPATTSATSIFSQPTSQPSITGGGLMPTSSTSIFGQSSSSIFGSSNNNMALSANPTPELLNSAGASSSSIFGNQDGGGLFGNSQGAASGGGVAGGAGGAAEPNLFAPNGAVWRCKRKKV